MKISWTRLQEYFIRHVDGYALDTASEKERVIKCLEAALERRVCEVIELRFKYVFNSLNLR